MFESFRQLGRVTDDVPFALLHSASQTLIVASVGYGWHAYDAETLQLVLIGPKFGKRITALCCCGNLTFAATKGGIEICRRVNRVGALELPAESVVQLIRIGDVLVALLDTPALLIWNVKHPEELPIRVELDRDFCVTCVTHPATYVNKLLVGGEDGTLQLWNFQFRKKLYSFGGWTSPVRCLESSPALDVVAVGLANGSVVLLNVKYDAVVHRFEHAKEPQSALASPCTAVAFTTGLAVPLMATGGLHGEILIWDLKQKELLCSKQNAHGAKLRSLHFFPGKAVLLSSAEDNALKQWTVDVQSRELRVLRQRCGPRHPAFCVRFYDAGLKLLACDKQGAMWCLSTIQDQQNRELSTKKRSPLATAAASGRLVARPLALDACSVRERDWGHVLSVHQGQRSPCLWSLRQYSIERTTFRPSNLLPVLAASLQPSAVAVSPCGNFALVGYHSGSLHKFNVQSGIHRGEYQRAEKPAHKGRVTGCAVDRCNRHVMSAGCDGAFRIWSFKERRLLFQSALGSPVHSLSFHRGNALCAVGLDNLSIHVLDCEARRRVRSFKGHTDRLTDLEISSDGRWLLTAAMDCTLRIYDIPSATSISVMAFKQPAVSLSLSPSMELLVTAHLHQKSVSLWTNQWIFGGERGAAAGAVDAAHFPERGGQKLVRLAMLPMSGWRMAYGQTIKQQKGPRQPVQERPPAPFFLPPLLEANTRGGPSDCPDEEPVPKKRRTEALSSSEFRQHLQGYADGRDRAAFSEFLKRQSPVYIEQELLSISRDSREDIFLLQCFLQFIEALLEAKEDVEFSQVLLKLALRSNTECIIHSDDLAARIRDIQSALQDCWTAAAALMDATQCMISLFCGLHS